MEFYLAEMANDEITIAKECEHAGNVIKLSNEKYDIGIRGPKEPAPEYYRVEPWVTTRGRKKPDPGFEVGFTRDSAES